MVKKQGMYLSAKNILYSTKFKPSKSNLTRLISDNFQYKKNEPSTSNNTDITSRRGECGRYQRIPNIESPHTLSDSSDTDAKQSHNHSDIKRRKNTNKSVEQCEKEIQKLQKSVDTLRQKLEESELKDVESISHHSDSKIRSIIGRFVSFFCI